MKVSASILAADFSNLKEEIEKIPNVDYLHMDVMDGHFVPNISFGACVLKSLSKVTDTPFDTHLMIAEPSKYIEEFAKYSDIITIHCEVEEDINALLDMIHNEGCKAGISISPKTPVDEIKQYLDKVDLVLVMTVEPGFAGQEFMEEVIPKFAELRKLQKTSKFEIEVDGGINYETIKKIDADIVVSGAFIFHSENPADVIDGLKKQTHLEDFE
ncbi:ribulose-phosphate 3-epimerase [Candidatus Woesearchaeota archaeon]|nr:ribulose-phosphate 3-epimerase [Candidatus Woesearchaeota archaeon]MBW3014302.1 ribulose-phosphate 3-epimerase [Candidatus Woesearchaeota archaeon]